MLPTPQEVAQSFLSWNLRNVKVLEIVASAEEATIRLENFNSKNILNQMLSTDIIGVTSTFIKVRYNKITITIKG